MPAKRYRVTLSPIVATLVADGPQYFRTLEDSKGEVDIIFQFSGASTRSSRRRGRLVWSRRGSEAQYRLMVHERLRLASLAMWVYRAMT